MSEFVLVYLHILTICRGEDSNLQGLIAHMVLSHARLPVSPPRHKETKRLTTIVHYCTGRAVINQTNFRWRMMHMVSAVFDRGQNLSLL